MTLLNTRPIDRTETVSTLRSFVDLSCRLVVLSHDEDDDQTFGVLDSIRESILTENGQYLSFSRADFDESSFPSLLEASLKDFRKGKPFLINLPEILRSNPKTDSPFINRAILWQRLCDRLIEDEAPNRPTLLVMEDFLSLSPQTRHELARLIRFHATYQIRRTFLLVVRNDEWKMFDDEIVQMVEEHLEM